MISTIYGANGSVKKLAKASKTCFLVGTNKGSLITNDLENLKKNVPSLEKQRYVFKDQQQDTLEISNIIGLESVE